MTDPTPAEAVHRCCYRIEVVTFGCTDAEAEALVDTVGAAALQADPSAMVFGSGRDCVCPPPAMTVGILDRLDSTAARMRAAGLTDETGDDRD